MAVPNVSEIIASTLEARSAEVADNVTNNNALLLWLKKRGNVRTAAGGRLIYENLAFAENANGGSYAGYDTLPVAASDQFSAAEFNWKLYAVPVVMSGEEEMMNSGESQVFDLMEERIKNAEATMANLLSDDVYEDGTGNGGKNITGVDLAVPDAPSTGTYGGIDRATAAGAFWQSKLLDPGTTPTSSTIQGHFNTLWADCSRGSDHPNLIICDTLVWAMYVASLQAIQRLTDPSKASLGFPTLDFMGSDVVRDDVASGATASRAYFLNTKYLHWRPHEKRNMVPLNPQERYAINQDARVNILGFMGNLTCSGAKFQGRLIAT